MNLMSQSMLPHHDSIRLSGCQVGGATERRHCPEHQCSEPVQCGAVGEDDCLKALSHERSFGSQPPAIPGVRDCRLQEEGL